MAAGGDEVVVTEGMLTEATGAGDVDSLTIWARQGVRVTSAEPLFVAARGSYSAVFRQLEVVRLLVQQMGANVSESVPPGPIPLMLATKSNNLALVQCLVVELGADVNQAGQWNGPTPLIMAASIMANWLSCAV
jgi:hypothetical protein